MGCLSPGQRAPLKPRRGLQHGARLSHHPVETTADAIREAKPKHARGAGQQLGHIHGSGSWVTPRWHCQARGGRTDPAPLSSGSAVGAGMGFGPPVTDGRRAQPGSCPHRSAIVSGDKPEPGSSALEFILLSRWGFLKNSKPGDHFSLSALCLRSPSPQILVIPRRGSQAPWGCAASMAAPALQQHPDSKTQGSLHPHTAV